MTSNLRQLLDTPLASLPGNPIPPFLLPPTLLNPVLVTHTPAFSPAKTIRCLKTP